VLKNQLRIATNYNHAGSTAAATFLAKSFGKFKTEKQANIVDRVSYVEPGALRELSERAFPELRS
jgi:hypothetical protein